MAFSKSMASVGTFEVWKLFHMVEVVAKALYQRFRHRIPSLYYMPGGSSFTPVARDIFILFFLRPVFRRTIFHFRAAGVSEVVDRQPALLRRLARFVYRQPDLAIHLSDLNPDDGPYFSAKRTVVVPNGLEDAAEPYLPIERQEASVPTILFVGVVQETKGVMVLLEAAKVLKEQGHIFRVNMVGDFASEEFKRRATDYCRKHGLEEQVHWAGVQKGEAKWQYFLEADVFCFPSFFEAESFGNVAVEAMMFSLPVVATRWRGIPSIVDDRETGLLVPTKNATAVSEAVARLIADTPLRQRLGKAGRAKYEQKYRIETFISTIGEVLLERP
jgi:glycosyltransferase involved in cell wall biosynthesis